MRGRRTLTVPPATEQVLYKFSGGGDGSNPYAGLIRGNAGSLCGTTVYGGKYASGFQGFGVVFKLSPRSGGGWTETVLHSFDNNG